MKGFLVYVALGLDVLEELQGRDNLHNFLTLLGHSHFLFNKGQKPSEVTHKVLSLPDIPGNDLKSQIFPDFEVLNFGFFLNLGI